MQFLWKWRFFPLHDISLTYVIFNVHSYKYNRHIQTWSKNNWFSASMHSTGRSRGRQVYLRVAFQTQTFSLPQGTVSVHDRRHEENLLIQIVKGWCFKIRHILLYCPFNRLLLTTPCSFLSPSLCIGFLERHWRLTFNCSCYQ